MSLQKAQLTCLYVPRGCAMCAEWHQRVALPLAGMWGHPLDTSTQVGPTGASLIFPVHSGCKANANTALEHCY